MKTILDDAKRKKMFGLGMKMVSLEGLMSTIPKTITSDWHDELELSFYWDSVLEEWTVLYNAVLDKDRGICFHKQAKELIDALYEMLVWLVEQGYIVK